MSWLTAILRAVLDSLLGVFTRKDPEKYEVRESPKVLPGRPDGDLLAELGMHPGPTSGDKVHPGPTGLPDPDPLKPHGDWTETRR